MSLLAAGFFVWLAIVMAVEVLGACEQEPITANTPTGIAGCYRQGTGLASHYGPGSGAAMNYCTWELRHGQGCGSVTITSLETERTVTVPVIDFCDCYTGTARERLVDLQYDVVEALGLPLEQGIYPVRVRLGASQHTGAGATLPDTATGG